ncbi:MAG: beta-glucosidase [Gammaproteobacteria bacterium]|nr:beta-glucosidase [Gammaproteobacteria bacterium]
MTRLGQSSIEDVVAAMTLEEKVRLLRGKGVSISGEGGPTVGVKMDERVPGAAGSTFALERLGIPSLVMADGPAGVRIAPQREGSDVRFHATAFPIATLLASTWDQALVEDVGSAFGHEAKEYGIDVLLAPALNLHRFPLGGRNFEYYAEDPLLSGKMAAAFVRGLQSQGVGASIKHFVANNHEWNRFAMDVKVDERALRELYLRGFEIAVKESQPWTVMSSYNKVNGEYTSECARLLTCILREEWGYDGLVVTDWFAGQDVAAQVRAGNDLLMPGTDAEETEIGEALASGALEEASVDRNVANLLRLALKSPTFAAYAYGERPDLASSAVLARRSATEGMVLLKNDAGVLPFAGQGSLALFGNHAYDLIAGGTGSGDVNKAYSVSLREGLEAGGAKVDTDLAAQYQAHLDSEKAKQPKLTGLAAFMPKSPIVEMTLASELIETAADRNAAAILVIGRTSGEFADREASDFLLDNGELSLLGRVSRAFRSRRKPIVCVLNIGGVVEVASWRDKVDALLVAWQPGQEGGHAIADVLLGEVNPSGRLPDSFPMMLSDLLAAENFPGVATGEAKMRAGAVPVTPSEIEYRDGIWVGYRYLNTFDKEVAYPFGHGLSYAEFTMTDLDLSSESFEDELVASVKVANTGARAGKEVAQVYISAPSSDGFEKPSEELRAFAKTRLLSPGESQVLSFRLTLRDLASFDATRDAWVADSGTYVLKVGASSRDIRASARFRLASTRVIGGAAKA